MAFTDLVEQADRAVQSHLGGEEIIYAPQAGEPVPVTGIFDENFVLLRPGESSVEQVGPAVFFRLEDLPVDPEQDEPVLTIGGVDYTVRERMPDGLGGIRLLLHLAPAAES